MLCTYVAAVLAGCRKALVNTTWAALSLFFLAQTGRETTPPPCGDSISGIVSSFESGGMFAGQRAWPLKVCLFWVGVVTVNPYCLKEALAWVCSASLQQKSKKVSVAYKWLCREWNSVVNCREAEDSSSLGTEWWKWATRPPRKFLVIKGVLSNKSRQQSPKLKSLSCR